MRKNKGQSNKKGFKHCVLKPLFFLCFLCGVIITCAVGVYALTIVSKAEKINPTRIRERLAETSIIYDDEGNKIKSLNEGENRSYVVYKDVPVDLVHAYVALEDKTFFQHHGFNVKRISGAIWSAFRSDGSVSGTSTITQQLARNIYLTKTMSDRTMERKILEAWYTLQMERELSKEQIMEYYLNTINLGFGNYGVKAAASSYFSKYLDDLTIAECAALASLPQAPSTYAFVEYVDRDSLGDVPADLILKKTDNGGYIVNDSAKDRRQVCLSLMKKQGYIDAKAYEEAKAVALTDMLDVNLTRQDTTMSYFTDYLVEVLADDLETELAINYDEAINMIYAGGLRIYSTVDQESQEIIADKFADDSNFPGISNVIYDYNDNILDDDGNISLYYKDYLFEDGEYHISEDNYRTYKDGSIGLKDMRRLSVDLSDGHNRLVLPPMYVEEDGNCYIINGGSVLLPDGTITEKDGWYVLSSKYIASDEGKSIFTVTEDGLSIAENACDLQQAIIQPQAAMTIIENETGYVKAMVGGRDIDGEMIYNRAVKPRQPGSSIKPLTVYSAALQQSATEAKNGIEHHFVDYDIDSQGIYSWGNYITAGSYVRDEPTRMDGEIWPRNASGGYYGGGTLRKALVTSTNTCAYKIWMQVGPKYSADMGEKFGLTTIVTEGEVNDMNPAALALGGMTKGVSTLEMANAYTVFPNYGTKSERPVFYTKVTNAEGKVILENEYEEVRVLDSSVAYIMADMMKGVVSSGTGTGARVYGVETGGKTGTTSSQYDIWFDGFTPNYSASLWIGNDMNMSLTSMSEYAARLWGNVMNDIPGANEGEYKRRPKDVIVYGGEYYAEGTI